MRGTAVRAAEKAGSFAKAAGAEASRSPGDLELHHLTGTSGVEKQGFHTRYARGGALQLALNPALVGVTLVHADHGRRVRVFGGYHGELSLLRLRHARGDHEAEGSRYSHRQAKDQPVDDMASASLPLRL